MKFNKLSLFAFVLLSAFSIIAAAQPTTDQSQTSQTTQTSQTSQDGQIVKGLMIINNNEVQLGRLAEKKATNPMVKQYAQTMTLQHAKNMHDLFRLAKKLKIAPVDSDDSKNFIEAGKKEMTDLSAKTGKDFDTAFMTAMVSGHQDALNFLDKSISSASNQELANFLKTTKDVVTKHLQMAKDVQSKLM